MKIFSLLYIILLIGPSSLNAQQDAYHWRIGGYTGVMNYYGELNQRFFAPNDAIINNTFDALSYGISLEKSLSQSWSNKFLYTNGKFYANDRAIHWNGNADTDRSNYERSLNARTDIQDLSMIFTYYFDNDRIFGRRAIVSPYVGFGFGITKFEVFGDLYDDLGNRYHYWSDNTIRNEAETLDAGNDANIIDQNGKYETNLTDLGTEKEYKTTILNIPFGVGLKFRLNSRFNLNLDYTARYAFTDYLDDVSGNYRASYDNELQEYASNPTNRDRERRGNSSRNDFYSFASISLHYNFGKKVDKYIAPRIYPSSNYYQVTQKEEDKLDTLDYTLTLDRPSPAILTKPYIREFYPIPLMSDSFNEHERATFSEDMDDVNTNQEMIPIQPFSKPIHSEVENKYRLQNDTIRQLEYEVKKIRLQNELYDLKRNSLDPSIRQKVREDSLRNSSFEKRLNSDTLKKGSRETGSYDKTNTSDSLGVEARQFNTADMSALQSPTTIDDSEDADGFNDMQNEIDGLKRTLNDLENNQNGSVEDMAAINQLQRRINALSLSNTQPNTVIIERESTPYIGNLPRVQSTVGIVNLERRMDLLSEEVNNANSHQTTQDSINLLAFENAKRTQANLNNQIDSLNRQLNEAALKEDSMKWVMVTAERDSLTNQVKQLQESLVTLKSEKPDTVEREVMTIHEFPKTEVFFGVNSSVLSENDKKRIREVADMITKYSQVQVIIGGFTDKTGSAAYNKTLSNKRAKAVEEVLVLSNISANRITTESNGVDDDLKKKASQYGRRVEIILSTPK